MFRNLFRRSIQDVEGLFTDHFVEVKACYVQRFDQLPCVSFIGELDITTAFAFLHERLGLEIVTVLQHAYFDHEEDKMFFNNSIMILSSHRMIEVAGNYCQLLHRPYQYDWARALIKELAAFRDNPVASSGHVPVIGFARQTNLN